ncbi:MAG: hypothetical protein U9Q77_04000 [Candidatus Marinimicrobia bacterium]|nr:hypothetical protein [Candidatus Neomarinimicrobiota bacterium]
MKRLVVVLSVISLSIIMINCAKQYPLTVADVAPKLAQFSEAHNWGFTDEGEFVEYYQIGDPNFDNFFKTAAKLDGLVIIANGMTKNTTKQLKKYAMSKAADESLQEDIKATIGDTAPEDYSTEQSLIVMKLAKQHDKVSKDELKYFATSSASLSIAVIALGKGVNEVGNLLKDGATLLKNVKSTKPWLIPAATKGIKGSIENLMGFKNNAPKVLEEMKVLHEGFKAMG